MYHERVPSDQANLLVLLTDHGRADSLGAIQAGLEVTPAANALARRGWTAERCYTPCPLCVPARTALATGVAPWTNGVACNEFARGERTCRRSIHEHLAAAGYRLGHVGVHHARLSPDLRDRVEFDLFADFDAHRQAAAAAGVALPKLGDEYRRHLDVRENTAGNMMRPYSSAATGVWRGPEEWFLDLWLARQAAAFIEKAPGDRPFALFVNLCAPHPPLAVPERYAGLFDPESIELPANVGQPARGEPPSRRLGPPAQLAAGVDEAGWRRAWAAHLALTRLADDATATVLNALTSRGLGDRTLTILASDHGEQLGQHAMYQKMELYEPAVRVPLVVAGPGVAAGARGEGICSLLDVPPTLLEAAGVAVPRELDGVSLWPSLRGDGPLPDRVLPLGCYGNFDLAPPPDQRRGAVDGRWKLIADGDGRDLELFDLHADPLEMHNLAGDPAVESVVARLLPQIAPTPLAAGSAIG